MAIVRTSENRRNAERGCGSGPPALRETRRLIATTTARVAASRTATRTRIVRSMITAGPGSSSGPVRQRRLDAAPNGNQAEACPELSTAPRLDRSIGPVIEHVQPRQKQRFVA